MAFGNSNYDNNNKRKNNDPTTYSAYSMANLEGVDPSRLSFEFWGNLLKIIISPKLQSNDDKISFDYENQIVAYVTHTKARILSSEIRDVLRGEKDNGGILIKNTTLVTFSNGKEFGCGYVLVIRQLTESGGIGSTYIYEFNIDKYHTGAYNFNGSKTNSEYSISEYADLEIKQLLDMLDQYVLAMTNAIGHSVLNTAKYRDNRMQGMVEDICSNLGIQVGNKNGGSRFTPGREVKGNTSNFSTNGSSGRSEVVNDLDAMMGPED